VDINQPSPARVYDAWLGGAHNFAADRAFAERVASVMPELPAALLANRRFLRRAVEFLVGRGVTQFLDLGSGIPTVSNVHEIAFAANPRSRVAYVDCDPVAVAHAERLLAGDERVAICRHDLRDPYAVLSDSAVTGLLDFSRPVAVLMFAVLHFVGDEDRPGALVARYLRDLSPGSYLALSHATTDTPDASGAGRVGQAADLYTDTVAGFHLRSRAEVSELFEDLELVEPGLADVTTWHAEDPDEATNADRLPGLCGVARLR
jgi:hypothetical protein